MIRITVKEENKEEVVLKVEGSISGDYVGLLGAEGERYLQQTRCLVLDLGGVEFIDKEGIRLFQQWSGDRLVLQNSSSFVKVMLKMHRLI